MSNKIYFASDFHLGVDAGIDSRSREKVISSWMKGIEEGSELFLLGDVFDYWFEYGEVIPMGFSRLIAALVLLRDKNVKISLFTGNHDSWMFNYFQEELGIEVYHNPKIISRQGKTVMLGHGDGLGPGDRNYKRIKKIFRNPLAQKVFSIIHPTLGIRIMKYFSKTSRETSSFDEYTGEDEWLVQFCKEKLQKEDIDYFIFGHRHIVIDYDLGKGSRYINIGDWIKYFSYGVMENGEVEIKFYKEAHKVHS